LVRLSTAYFREGLANLEKNIRQKRFDGEGAYRYGGRWDSRGVRVVYLSSSPALAALEVLVNVADPQLLYTIPYVVIPVEFDEAHLSRPERLPKKWKEDPPPKAAARIGDAWVMSAASLLLEVPSAVVPFENNYLLNPAHPAMGSLHIGDPQGFNFDPRLLRRQSSRE
jgi:RES domain-containing protein